MALPMLVIDKNTEFYKKQNIAWVRRGFTSVRVDSMLEGIEKLVNSNFILVTINGDNINYIPQMKIMRDVTHSPIFIIKKDYTLEEHTAALYEGADALVKWAKTDEANVEGGLALLNRLSECTKRHKKAIKILCYGNLLLALDYHQVFVNDAEIRLTKTEFDILAYLLINRGRVLSHRQILRRIWGDEYDQTTQDVLWKHINRLRKKLISASPECDFIQSMYSIGYKFQTKTDKKE